jgi:hypothetical protein
MNTVRILICATFALLIAALVHTYSTKTDSNDKSVAELRQELERVRRENSLDRERFLAPAPYGQARDPFANPNNISSAITDPNNTPPSGFVNPIASDTLETPSAEELAIEALEAENAKLKELQSIQQAENDMLNQEADVLQNELLTNDKPDTARAAEIAQALVMARVQTYDVGSGIIVLDLERAENLSAGQVLGIRRGDTGGIIGRIRLSNIQSPQIGFADPIAESFFSGPIDIQADDEIIVIP